jgi:hypothetical protein
MIKMKKERRAAVGAIDMQKQPRISTNTDDSRQIFNRYSTEKRKKAKSTKETLAQLDTKTEKKFNSALLSHSARTQYILF